MLKFIVVYAVLMMPQNQGDLNLYVEITDRISMFDDKKTCTEYIDSPEHKEVLKNIVTVLPNVLRVSFKCKALKFI